MRFRQLKQLRILFCKPNLVINAFGMIHTDSTVNNKLGLFTFGFLLKRASFMG